MPKRTLAAFDFDGTLTTRDSLIPFIFFVKGILPTLGIFLTSIPYVFLYLLGKKSRQELKEFYLSKTLKGMPEENAKALGESFAKDKLDSYLRKGAIKKIQSHLDKGDEIVLISANLDIYLIPWGKRHGFKNVLSSQVKMRDGKVHGTLYGKNCRGEEKVKRLLAWAGPKSEYTLWAYGDSKGDTALLKFADYPIYRGI